MIRTGTDSLGRPRRISDISGQVFGRLTAIRPEAEHRTKKGFSTIWLCRCTCGKTCRVQISQLKRKSTRSCGCFRRERISQTHSLPSGVASLRRAVARVESGARRRNLEWSLSASQVIELIFSPCHYCGTLPCTPVKNKFGKGDLLRNGIDRKLSHLGYVFSNCVACCGPCNRLKSTTPYEIFVGRCLRIAQNLRRGR
jgi:hypothetical protein